MVEPLKKVCLCGETVWDVTRLSALPRFTEWVVCRGCGTDYSREPSLRARWRHGVYTFHKRKRIHRRLQKVLRFGLYARSNRSPPEGTFWEALRLGIIDLFLMQREREVRKGVVLKAIQQPTDEVQQLPEAWRVKGNGKPISMF